MVSYNSIARSNENRPHAILPIDICPTIDFYSKIGKNQENSN